MLIAEHFGIPVDTLLDDSKELPFESYLSSIRSDREKAEKAYPGNEPAQMHGFDYLQQKRQMKREAERLRHAIAELASIAYSLDPSDERLHQLVVDFKKKP